MFSYDIPCSQQEDIGDIRTNWELNRHFQFSALAKSYYISGCLLYTSVNMQVQGYYRYYGKYGRYHYVYGYGYGRENKK